MIVVELDLVLYILVADDNTVEIHRVLHGKRNYPNMLQGSLIFLSRKKASLQYAEKMLSVFTLPCANP